MSDGGSFGARVNRGKSRRSNRTVSRRPADSGTLIDKNFTDLLNEYIYLELGTSKKEIFNFVHLGQSMRIANSNSAMKLINTMIQCKVMNTQLEFDFGLACMCSDADECPKDCNKCQDELRNNNSKLIFPCLHLEESNFKNQFFVTRSSFNIICSHLMQEYSSSNYKRSEPDVEKQLLVTLIYLGTVLSYKEIGTKFDIAISTAHKCVNDIINILFKQMGELVYWPIDQQANLEIQAFNEMPGNQFPGILGVIGTVDLKKTCTSNPSKHTKDRTSIAIQCVCNTKYQFYNVYAKYLHKSSVSTSTFLESPLAEMMLNNPDKLFPSNSHIVGTNYYPQLLNLMTPFSDETNISLTQHIYNNAISSPLNLIKMSFGKLLTRFKRLLCLDMWGQDKFAILIFAACCIHNVCLSNNDDIVCEPYECCSFKCDYHDELSVQKREEICKEIFNEMNAKYKASS